MTTRKMCTPVVMLTKQRLEMRQRIILAKYPDDAISVIVTTMVELMSFQLCKFPYQFLVDNKVLLTVFAW